VHGGLVVSRFSSSGSGGQGRNLVRGFCSICAP